MNGIAWTAMLTAFSLAPFGEFNGHLHDSQAWYGFDAQGPVLNLVRVQAVEVTDCKTWADALVGVPGSMIPLSGDGLALQLHSAWSPSSQPLSGKELDSIKDCDDFPCAVKFNEAETREMAKAPKDGRLARFFELVARRVSDYSVTQIRKSYESPGDPPVDPWKELEAKGLKPPLALPTASKFYARTLNFAPDKMQTIHQVLDRRSAESPDGTSAMVWVRDAYTDHYFDGWGEWSMVSCEQAKSEEGSRKHLIIAQGLLCEMDLLKSHSIFAKFAFGKYRSAFDENGRKFLDGEFDRISAIAKGAAK